MNDGICNVSTPQTTLFRSKGKPDPKYGAKYYFNNAAAGSALFCVLLVNVCRSYDRAVGLPYILHRLAILKRSIIFHGAKNTIIIIATFSVHEKKQEYVNNSYTIV